MATRAASPFITRDDLRVVALRAALVAVAAALVVFAWGRVFAFFGGGIGLAGHLFPRPTPGFWWFAAVFAVCVVVPASVVERAALRRRLEGQRALLAALVAGSIVWPAGIVTATQVIYLRSVLAGAPADGYSGALAWVTQELRLPARLLIGEGLALSLPVVLVTLARLHRVPLAPTLVGVMSTSAIGAAMALGVVTGERLRSWLVTSPVFWRRSPPRRSCRWPTPPSTVSSVRRGASAAALGRKPRRRPTSRSRQVVECGRFGAKIRPYPREPS